MPALTKVTTTGEEALTVGPLEANVLASKVVKVAKTGPSDCESMKSERSGFVRSNLKSDCG